MTSRRAALYGGLGILAAAYLAAANSSPVQDAGAPRDRAPRAAATSGTESLVSDVQTQAARLRARMQRAPVPDSNPRNPFAFGEAAVRPRTAGVVHATVADPPPAALPAPPPLTLMGMAEDATPQGPRRTAVIGGANADTVYMVTEGETLLGRYRVAKIGADAVELDDLVTHGLRRLAMR